MKETLTDDYLETRNKLLEELTDIRIEKKLTQKKAGRISGLSQSTVSRLESGDLDPRLKTLLKYLTRLNKTIKIVDI